MNKILKPLIITFILTLSTTTVSLGAATRTYTANRLSGANRTQTAKSIANYVNSGTTNNVILTTGDNFPDALSSSLLAKTLDAPTLLVSNGDSSDAVDYIKNHLSVDGTIYVLGGQGAVSDTVLSNFKQKSIRLSGAGRYETNVAINNKINAAVGTPIIIATGEDFPDALSMSSISGIKKYPIVLTTPNAIPEIEKAYITAQKPTTIYIAGGLGAVNASVVENLKALTNLTDNKIIRISGNNRYDTSRAIAEQFKLTGSVLTLATGADFPDALSGSLASSKANSAILLVNNIDATNQADYVSKATNITDLNVLGGVGAISEKTLQLIWGSNSNTIITPLIPTPALKISDSVDLRFSDAGNTDYGDWTADIIATPAKWQPGASLQLKATLRINDTHLEKLAANKIKADGFVMLVTAERTFDADGIMHLPSDEKMSTLFTTTGLPIEGGVQGAVTNRFGYGFRTPVDELVTVPLSATQKTEDGHLVTFNISTKLPDDLPPGLYRLRLDYGVTVAKKLINLNGQAFAQRGFPTGPHDTESYSSLIQASAKHVSGRMIDASTIKPSVPGVLLGDYNSNGYRGVVAEEDKVNFGLSSRNLIQDDVILPLYDENNPKNKLSYNLEPKFPTDLIDNSQNIPWDYTKGYLSIQVTAPDGNITDLGSAPFIDKTAQLSPTTKNTKFTQWKPQIYGEYSVKVTEWITDTHGNNYVSGGTYKFWIAKRITLATATFQGQSYPVGSRYGRDIGFSPAVPADVQVTASLYVNSDRKNAETVTYSGKASPGGIFGAAQGMKPLLFDKPGEYSAKIFAKYIDADGHLWVESMRHTGVIYPEDTSIVAHGKMVQVQNKLVERGDTNLEGWHDLTTDEMQLQHINFPYNAGDVLLIASDGQGANKIEPMLSWANKVSPAPYDSKIQGIGLTNLRIQTSNGYSPHLFPEYITDWMYFYAGAPRPGFMGRFLVGETGIRAPYWPTTSNNFGGQINASNNGDAPGDIYRLLGGVVIRKKDQTSLYAGYMANAFIVPKGTKDNSVIAPGSEELLGSTGQKARAFIAMNARPGMVYDVGTTFAPALQIDPMVPINITFTMTYPDGRKVVAAGIADATGSFVGKDRWTLDVPGVYKYTIDSDWNGYKAVVPGLPKEGGEMYVIEKEKSEGSTGLTFILPALSKFDAAKGTKFVGNSTAKEINFAVIIPGAVLMQGKLPVTDGKFEFSFDPASLHKLAQTYDTTNTNSGKSELGDVVHLTFFSEETTKTGTPYHSFVRLIIRGNTVNYTR